MCVTRARVGHRYSDEELRNIAASTGAIAGYSKQMSSERLRDAYSHLAVRPCCVQDTIFAMRLVTAVLVSVCRPVLAPLAQNHQR